MRCFLVAAVVPGLLAGCGGSGRPVPPGASRGQIPTVACSVPRSLARAPLPQETGAYRAGPLLLVTGEDLAHRFAGGVVFNGTGCASLHMTKTGGASLPLLIPIGNTLQGCPARAAHTRLPQSVLPFLGVACSQPNSIACDRVGVGVHLKTAATLVTVTVAGRLVTLNPPLDPPDDLWYGYLSDAGLPHGPLDVHRPPGRLWFGTPEVYPRVRVTAFFADGAAASLPAVDFLHPGFG